MISVFFQTASQKIINVSNERIAHMISGDEAKTLEIRNFQKFLDIFRLLINSETRYKSIESIYQKIVENSKGNFERFQKIANYAHTSGNNAVFTCSIKPDPLNIENYILEYRINCNIVKTDSIDEAEKQRILAHSSHRNAEIHNDILIQSLEVYLLNTSSNFKDINFQDFSTGGANKKYDENTGLVLATNNSSQQDFEIEAEIEKYATNLANKGNPELKNCISTQKMLPSSFYENTQIKYKCAATDVYDSNFIKMRSLKNALTEIKQEQAAKICTQIINIIRVLYECEISHNDLHMENIIVHQFIKTSEEHVKIIDFGRSSMGNDFKEKKFNDIKYIFLKEGDSLPETMIRKILPDNSNIVKKHFPLHKIFENFAEKNFDTNEILKEIGQNLIKDLQKAGEDTPQIKNAFDNAQIILNNAFDVGCRNINLGLNMKINHFAAN